MEFLYCFITFLLVIGSFCCGIKLSDHYHRIAEETRRYALEKQYSRLLAGCDADDPVQPYVAPPVHKRRFQVTPEFEQTFRQNGSATMQVGNQNAM